MTNLKTIVRKIDEAIDALKGIACACEEKIDNINEHASLMGRDLTHREYERVEELEHKIYDLRDDAIEYLYQVQDILRNYTED